MLSRTPATCLAALAIILANTIAAADGSGGRKTIAIPTVDISDETTRHVIVAQGTEREWQGHPHTLLLPDKRTILCAWAGRQDGTRGHGAPGGLLKRSEDGGRTWSKLLPVPATWRELGRGHPTLHRLVDPKGVARIMLICRDENRTTFLQAISEDEGRTWSPMRRLGLINPKGEPIVGWTAPINIEPVKVRGVMRHLMWYERGREGRPSPGVIWQAASYDGGLTWGEARAVVDKAGASEPAVIRSPDGRQLLLLIRENQRELNSLYSISGDEGATWSQARELPAAMTGDRHLARYSPDGRMVVMFRARAATKDRNKIAADGHCVAWVGRYEDIVQGREGQYRIKLIHSHGGYDHTYPGLEVLPDGTFVGTTYIKYRPGPEQNSVVSMRFKLEETDRKLGQEGRTPGSNFRAK